MMVRAAIISANVRCHAVCFGICSHPLFPIITTYSTFIRSPTPPFVLLSSIYHQSIPFICHTLYRSR